jgi:hypothetical protein
VSLYCSIPGSHKINLIHPAMEAGGGLIPYSSTHSDASHALAKSHEVHQKAGDALLFVDCCLHGSAPRTATMGQRRFVVYRYGPGMLGRYGCASRTCMPNYHDLPHPLGADVPSPDLLRRLTPSRREIIAPVPPLLPPMEVQEISSETGAVSVASGFGPVTPPCLPPTSKLTRGRL